VVSNKSIDRNQVREVELWWPAHENPAKREGAGRKLYKVFIF
jgi:hypothetical protein